MGQRATECPLPWGGRGSTQRAFRLDQRITGAPDTPLANMMGNTALLHGSLGEGNLNEGGPL